LFESPYNNLVRPLEDSAEFNIFFLLKAGPVRIDQHEVRDIWQAASRNTSVDKFSVIYNDTRFSPLSCPLHARGFVGKYPEKKLGQLDSWSWCLESAEAHESKFDAVIKARSDIWWHDPFNVNGVEWTKSSYRA